MKRVLALIFILLFISSVSAVKLIEPYSKDLIEDDFVGAVPSNSTLELIFSKENNKFDSLKLLTTLPEGFLTSTAEELESIKLFINVPKDAFKGSYSITVKLTDSTDVSVTDEVKIFFNVDDELVFVSMDRFSQEVFVGSKATFEFTLINNSDSDLEYEISSTLSKRWFESKKVLVPKKSKKVEKLSVVPQYEGVRIFNFVATFSDEVKNFQVTINVKPTIRSKFDAVLSGLPFYSFSLIPNYLLNGLIALLF